MESISTFFKELFEYNNQCNQKLIGVFSEQTEKLTDNSIKLVSHIINAHLIWNSRIQATQNKSGVWEIHDSEKLKTLDKENYGNSITIIKEQSLDKIVEYTNTKGQMFSNSIRDILFHVINHSTYHRAQIATEFKQSGLAPLVTDYIFYKR